MFKEVGEHERAIVEFQETLKLNPKFHTARYQMAISYLELGNKKEAKEGFKEYLDKAPHGEMAGDAKNRLAKL